MYFWCIMVPNEKKYLEFRQTMINNQLRTLGTLAAIVCKRFHWDFNEISLRQNICNRKLFLTCCIQLIVMICKSDHQTRLSIIMCVEVLWRCRSWAVCRADTRHTGHCYPVLQSVSPDQWAQAGVQCGHCTHHTSMSVPSQSQTPTLLQHCSGPAHAPRTMCIVCKRSQNPVICAKDDK